ncbi:MAG TPA: DUF1249 domain-containing protein [Chiayiivirga sp.]|nr:DUF1249 domain-containing protein [Chiayiivirga sp.]
MPIATHHRARNLQPSRFGHLMDLYAENFARFQRTFPLQRLPANHWRSSVDDGLDLHLDVIERHRYTTEIRLTYDLADPLTGAPDPSAYLRIYHDARLIEVTHCHLGRRWQDVLGLNPSLATLVGHRMRMNTFLWKWLDYLSDLGHSPFTLCMRGDHDDSCPREKVMLPY